jgi:hypothetical protein
VLIEAEPEKRMLSLGGTEIQLNQAQLAADLARCVTNGATRSGANQCHGTEEQRARLETLTHRDGKMAIAY